MKHRGPIGEDRLNRHARYRTLVREQREITDEIARDMTVEVDTVVQATLPGDSRRLRGIPAVGRVGGVITDSTVPGSDEHLEQWEGAA